MLMPAWMEVVLIQLRDGWTEPAGWADSGYPLLHQHNRSLNTSITIILILGGHQPVMAVGHHLCLASVSSATTYCRISRMPTNRTPRTGTHGDSCCWARCCPIRLTWSVCKMPITTRTGGGLRRIETNRRVRASWGQRAESNELSPTSGGQQTEANEVRPHSLDMLLVDDEYSNKHYT